MDSNNIEETEVKEIGFGSKNYTDSVRFINVDGSVNVQRTGLKGLDNIDIYHWLISATRMKLSIVIIVGYLLINFVFATIYFVIGSENFGGLNRSSDLQEYISLFFFSSQTITTLGYGHMYPISNSASVVAAIESLLGLLSFAIATGILFGRVSRPRAHILYSKNILISPYKDITGLMFRITNKKQYELIECEASLTMTINNRQTGKREFFNLNLEISRINFLALSWTIVHPIDPSSPIYGKTAKDLKDLDVEFLILIRGINDTFSQNVYSRYSYKADSVIEKARFKPLRQEPNKLGKLKISVTEIHNFDIVS
jgi:inward rectifier potassium channel